MRNKTVFEKSGKAPKCDLRGIKFGKLTPIEYITKSNWRCLCDCGKIIIANSHPLKKGYVVSCGCSRIKDLTGNKYGMLTVKEFVPTDYCFI